MSPSLMKMWISLASMGFMFLAILLIYLSRYKLGGVFKFVTALVAYLLMIVSGIIIFLVVFSGPTPE
jgi:amino acid transporter